jgi:hypothetical protein
VRRCAREDPRRGKLGEPDVDIDRRGRAAPRRDRLDHGRHLVTLELLAEHRAHARERRELLGQGRELASGEPRTERERRQGVERRGVEEVLTTGARADRAAFVDLAGERAQVQGVPTRELGDLAEGVLSGQSLIWQPGELDRARDLAE